MSDAFFDDVTRWTWAGGLRLPLFFPALSAMTAVFTASSGEARRLLPDARMRPVEVAPGRCLLTVAALDYRESDLGAYQEVAVALPIAFGGMAPAALDALRQGVGKAQSTYVWQLPVTTRAACDAGVDLYGFPKRVAEIGFQREERGLRCTLGPASDPELTLAVDADDRPGERRLKLRCYTVKEGRALVSTLVVRQTRFRDHLRRDAARLELGRGDIADGLRALRLSERPIAAQSCADAQAMLFFPRNVIDD